MPELSSEIEQQVRNALLAARGTPVTFTTQLEEQIYNGIMAAGGGGGGGQPGPQGDPGVTFIPEVSAAGVISWTNDGGLPNPSAVDIMGPAGPQGQTGPAGYGPSDKYADLSLPTSGSTVTITADGFLNLVKNATAANQYALLKNTVTEFAVSEVAYGSHALRIYLPVSRGDVVQVTYTAAGTLGQFRLIYSNGAAPG